MTKPGARSEERLFHQYVFAVPEQISQEVEFRLIWRADTRRIEGAEGDVAQVLAIGGADGVHCPNDVGTDGGSPFLSLVAYSNDDNAQVPSLLRSSWLSLSATSAGLIGSFTSRSQVIPAASDPNTEAITGDRVVTSARVE